MATANKIRQQLDYCQNIIDRPTTGAGERQAAKQARARLLAKLAKIGDTTAYADRRWYGAKYAETASLALTEIAKRIRADIKFAQKMAAATADSPGAVAMVDPIGNAPAEIKVYVRTEYYSGGGSINIFVGHVPPGWGFYNETEPYERVAATPALKAFGQALKDIMNAYNYDGSDITTDLFDKRFYGGVSLDWKTNEHSFSLA